MKNYQQSILTMISHFSPDEKGRLMPAVTALNEKVVEGYAVDSPEVKRRFRIFLLMVRQMRISMKQVPEDFFGENFMQVDDETLFKEGRELFKEMRNKSA
ncbi:hypothetical protein [Jeotgalibaca porci]|uniref:hypothetical protein n=1 Tax=Jeotgalibaca porci TaxID=1868793 RepID=UPI0035A05FCC